MAEKPILFNTKMVRAILAGQKIVTRRLVKPRCPGGKILDERPPYQVGDILYVRETWRKYHGKYYYKADECPDYDNYLTNKLPCAPKWHPSIHMPKETARIWLKVTDVRVDRLRNITYEDAIKEGCKGIPCEHHGYTVGGGMCGCTDCMNTGWLEPPTLEFMDLWNSTIKKQDIDSYGWDANPWVWVIEFERIEKSGGASIL